MNRKERRAARKTGQAGRPSQSFSGQLRDMGDRHAQAGDIAQAESLYRQALAGDPADIITLHRLGHLATRTGRIDERLGILQRQHMIRIRDQCDLCLRKRSLKINLDAEPEKATGQHVCRLKPARTVRVVLRKDGV